MPSGASGSAISTYTIAASNSPTSFNATGLPPGLSVNTGTGAITGTPTTTSSSSPFSVTISATNAGGTDTATLIFTITPDITPPTILSIVRLTPPVQSITSTTTSVTFRVTYSSAVQGVLTGSFALEGVNGGSITGAVSSVTGTGTTRDVTVTLSGGGGEFRLKPTN